MKFDVKKIGLKVAGVGAGALIAKAANKPLQNMDPKLRAGVKLVAGVMLPTFVKNEFVANVGDGMIAVAASELAEALFPALSGIGDTTHIEEDFTPVAGLEDAYAKGVYGIEEVPAV